MLFQTLHILRDKARIVFLFQTISTPLDLLRALLSGLGVREIQGSLVEMQIKLKDILTEQYRLGKRVVVVIDEAQNLDDSVLELMRMLSNFETSRDKLIQIILCRTAATRRQHRLAGAFATTAAGLNIRSS